MDEARRTESKEDSQSEVHESASCASWDPWVERASSGDVNGRGDGHARASAELTRRHSDPEAVDLDGYGPHSARFLASIPPALSMHR